MTMRYVRTLILTLAVAAAPLAALAQPPSPSAAPAAQPAPAKTYTQDEVDDLQAQIFALRATVIDLERRLGGEQERRASAEIKLLRQEAAALPSNVQKKLGMKDAAPASETTKPHN